MSVGIWQSADLPEAAPRVADVAIIGAGIIGAFLALRLSERGQQVVVLEARHVAGGASGRNGGLLLTGVAHSYASAVERYGPAITRDLWQVTVRNRESMIAWATRLGTPVRRCGSYILACSAEEAAELEASVELMRHNGFDASWHPSDPLGRGFVAAIHNPDDGAIQPARLTEALLRASGAELRECSEVYAIKSREDGVLLRSRTGSVLARQVVLATNAWTPLLAPDFAGVIVPARGQVLATAPAPPILSQACYCDYGFEYFQQRPDGRFVLGGYRNLAFEEEATYADHPTDTIQRALDGFLARHFPELAEIPVQQRWSGTMGFTPDGLPLIGRLRRDERIAFAVGFNGHGLGLGITVADALLDALDGTGDGGMFAARRLMPEAV